MTKTTGTPDLIKIYQRVYHSSFIILRRVTGKDVSGHYLRHYLLSPPPTPTCFPLFHIFTAAARWAEVVIMSKVCACICVYMCICVYVLDTFGQP